MYNKGDIVLIPFPFTDLTAVKTRPAVVVSSHKYAKETNNIIVAMITSMPYTTSYDYELKGWEKANLLAPSWVRAKFTTIDLKLVRYKPGKLTDSDLIEVNKIISLSLKM